MLSAEKSFLGVPGGILNVQLGSVLGPTGPGVYQGFGVGGGGRMVGSVPGGGALSFFSSIRRALTRQPEAGRTAASFGLRPGLSELGVVAMLEQVETFEGIKLRFAELPL